MKNPFTRDQKIATWSIITFLVVGVGGWVITVHQSTISAPINFSNSPIVNVNGTGDATAVGPNAKATVNHPAVYTWTNRNSWVTMSSTLDMEMAGGEKSGFRTDLVFDADGGLLPTMACLEGTASGVNVLYISPGMYGIFSINGSCISPVPRHVVLSIYTNAIPSNIQAQLIIQ